MQNITLDETYQMTAYIYAEQNAVRPVAATLSHFVEVCGMLTIHDRRKKKEGLNFVDALCKAFGWYFPLMAKLRVRSVEELVFRKYPLVCPYCRKSPHDDFNCKTVKGTESTVDHLALRRLYEANCNRKPRGLDDWQRMFQAIYPRSPDDKARSTLGLFEELGELAEAVRVFERYPKYFAGEAADTFSYLMGLANEFSLRKAQEDDDAFSLEAEYLKRYPGLCNGCGHRVCICPSIPRATVGRLSKELDIAPTEQLFDASDSALMSQGRRVGARVLQSLGGLRGVIEGFPADRGDANYALIMLLLKLAAATEKTQPELAERFHGAAIELGSAVAAPGVKASDGYLSSHEWLLEAIRETLRSTGLATEANPSNLKRDSLAFDLGAAIAKVRVLVVHASPTDANALRVAAELRAIRQALAVPGRESEFQVDDLPAARTDDLRIALLAKEYEIIHFAGHADANAILFETESGASASVSLEALAELLDRYKSVRCVVLNACQSVAALKQSIAPFTVGMETDVMDESAIAFAQGFYEAIARGKAIPFAVAEGRSAAQLRGLKVPTVRVLER